MEAVFLVLHSLQEAGRSSGGFLEKAGSELKMTQGL